MLESESVVAVGVCNEQSGQEMGLVFIEHEQDCHMGYHKANFGEHRGEMGMGLCV
jgi:hypothetical protein